MTIYFCEMYNFDEVIDRNGSDCIKYDALKTFFKADDLLPMWVADSDFRTPDFIMDAIVERAQHPFLGYTYKSDAFYRSIQSWIERRGGWKIEREWINLSAGVVAGISFALNALTEVGDPVLIQVPVYPPFADTVRKNGRKLLTNELINNDGHYEIDFADFEAKIRQARLFILCNPHNPVGRVFTADELRRMGELCVKYDVRIISDEIHSDIVFKPHRHTHIASLSTEIAARTVTLVAPSKTFNIAGLSTSVAIIESAEMRKKFVNETSKYHVDGNIFGLVALTAGYTLGDVWVDEMNDYLAKNIDFVKKFCRERMPKLKITDIEATYLMWIDFRGLNRSENDVVQSLITDAKVALNKGSDYGAGGEGFMRINVSAPLSVIKEGLERINITYKILG